MQNKLIEQSNHFYWLDLIRFLAAFMVVLSHARGYFFVEFGALIDTERTVLTLVFYAFTRIANEAVIVFFVLSGFLVGGRVLERISNGTFQPTNYAIDRFVRIMLPLVPALILTAIIRIVIDGDFSKVEFMGNLFSLQGIFVSPFGGNGPLWSLSYEVWFYVLAFFIGIITINKSFSYLSTLLLIMIGMVFTVLSPVYLFSWLIGTLTYLRRPNNFSWKLFTFAIILMLYSIVAVQLGYESISVSIEWLNKFLPALDAARVLLAAGIALFIQQLILLKPTKKIAINLDLFGTTLAKFSYTLYLTHYPFMQLLIYLGFVKAENINSTSLLSFLASIIFSFILAFLLYLVFEKHTYVVKKMLKILYTNYKEVEKK